MFCRKNSVYRDLLKEEGAIVHPEIKNLFSVRNILSGSAERIMDANNWYWKPKAAKALESAPVGVSKLLTTNHILRSHKWGLEKNGHIVQLVSIGDGSKYSVYASVFPRGIHVLNSVSFPWCRHEYRAVVCQDGGKFIYAMDKETGLKTIKPYDGLMGMHYRAGAYLISPMFCVNGSWKFANDLSIYELDIVRADHELTEDAARLLKRRREILEKS